MGLEATCEVTVGKKTAAAKVHLEPGEIRIGAPFKVAVPLAEVASFEAKGGVLLLRRGKERLALGLGKDADKWALRIRYPRGRLDKLGVKPGMRVAVIGLQDGEFLRELRERTTDVTEGKARAETDLVVVALHERRGLARLAALRARIKKNGAIWVVWPKGRKELREDDVRAHGPSVGLVDVKVMSFSDVLSGLKMVIPVAQR